jgi:archaellum component FlaC
MMNGETHIHPATTEHDVAVAEAEATAAVERARIEAETLNRATELSADNRDHEREDNERWTQITSQHQELRGMVQNLSQVLETSRETIAALVERVVERVTKLEETQEAISASLHPPESREVEEPEPAPEPEPEPVQPGKRKKFWI